MLLITIFVELCMVAGRSRTRAGSPQAVSRRPCCAVALRRTAWSEHGMGRGIASVNQTRSHCVNQMGKTHSNPLAARHGSGTAWARHAMCESAFLVPWSRKGSAIPPLPLWAVRPVQSLSACTRVHFTFTLPLRIVRTSKLPLSPK